MTIKLHNFFFRINKLHILQSLLARNVLEKVNVNCKGLFSYTPETGTLNTNTGTKFYKPFFIVILNTFLRETMFYVLNTTWFLRFIHWFFHRFHSFQSLRCRWSIRFCWLDRQLHVMRNKCWLVFSICFVVADCVYHYMLFASL